mgnify:CR=1 FL=1
MKNVYTCFLVILLAMALVQKESQAQVADTLSKKVVATGIGSIVGGDEAHARDDAIDDALRTALEQVMGMLLESETLVDNYQLLEDNIYSRTKGYVQTYKVIREGKRDSQLYEVTVEAVVKQGKLNQDLDGIAALMRRKNMPRLMVIINEKNIGDEADVIHYAETDLSVAENELMDRLMTKGYRFVDPATVRRNIESGQAAAILAGDTKEAAAIGRTLGAEIVLTGNAVVSATVVEAFGAKQRTQQATLNLRAIRTDTGDIIATATGKGAFPHINDITGGAKAIERACGPLSEEISEKILRQWQQDLSSGATIFLKVNGITGFELLDKIKTFFSYSVRGVTSVTQRSWQADFATFEISMEGDTNDLARRISKKMIDSFQITVTGMTQNSVTVLLKEI